MNKSDSQKIKTILEKNNYKPVEKPEKANLVIVNMCSVRQSAVDRVYGLANKFSKWKKNQDLKTALTGCILDQDKQKFRKRFDILFNKNNIHHLPEILSGKDFKGENKSFKYLNIKSKQESKTSEFIPIMSGCNNFCSYCVVPHTRGREVSRPADKIINEVKDILKRDIKKIVLLGQNVNSYKDKNTSFADLLKRIIKIDGKFWLNFVSSHPKDLSDDLIDVMANSDKITNYLHFAVQSGDNKILKAMNRNYKIEDYKEIIKKLRKKIPNITISTDVIVGFPGETKAQFQNTVDLFKWAKFDMAYIAKYSPRKMTAASNLDDNVSHKEKKKREKILTKILKKYALENNKKYLNKKIEVLVTSKRNNSFFGETKNNKDIKITSHSKNLKIGQFITCKICHVTPWHLRGRVVSCD